MRRRALLRRFGAGATLGTAACLDRPPGDGRTNTRSSTPTATGAGSATPRPADRTADGTDDGSATPVSGIPRRVELAAADDAALRSAYGVAAAVRVDELQVTDDHTAVVVVALANRGDEDRTLTYLARECGLNALFGSQVDGDGRLVLPPADVGWERADERCWRARPRDLSCGIPVQPLAVSIPAGGEVSWRFAVWGTPKAPCMPPGRYRFRRAFATDARTPPDDAPALTLTLSVTRPSQ